MTACCTALTKSDKLKDTDMQTVPHPFPFLPQESICAAQLITEDEGLGRLAHTVQVLVDLAPTAASHRRASRPEPLGADRLSTAPSFS